MSDNLNLSEESMLIIFEKNLMDAHFVKKKLN